MTKSIQVIIKADIYPSPSSLIYPDLLFPTTILTLPGPLFLLCLYCLQQCPLNKVGQVHLWACHSYYSMKKSCVSLGSTKLNQISTCRGELGWSPVSSQKAVVSCWGRESLFSLREYTSSCKSTTSLWKATHPGIFGHHKLVLLILRNKGYKIVWVEMGAQIWEK